MTNATRPDQDGRAGNGDSVAGALHRRQGTQKPTSSSVPWPSIPDEITHADDASGGPCGQPEQVRPGGTSLYGIAHGTTVEGILGTERMYLLQPGNGFVTRLPTKFIAGNVIGKAERIEAFLRENPDHAPARESLRLCARRRPNPSLSTTGLQPGRTVDSKKRVYERFASSLFDTEVKITFASNLDEYGVKAEVDEREDHGAVCRQRADP